MQVRAEVVGNRIAVTSPGRFPGDTEMSKRVPGGRWNKEYRFWHYPLSWTSCLILREVYTDMLDVGPKLVKWSRAEHKRIGRATRLAKRSDTTLHRVHEIAPALDAAMASRTYQRVGVKFLAQHRSVLLADEPTLGKTIQYLGGLAEANNYGGVHLVVAPKSSLKSVWADEIFKWTPWHPFWMPDGRARRERMFSLFMEDEHPSKFLLVNPEMLQTLRNHYCKKCELWEQSRAQKKIQPHGYWPDEHFTDDHKTKLLIQKQEWPQLFDIMWNSVIIDEAHNSLLGNRSAQSRTQAAEGLMRLRLDAWGMKVASTGTPLKGHALSFWSIFNWLRPDEYSNKWDFAEQFLQLTKHTFGTEIGEVRDDRQDALQAGLRTIMIRRTKKEVQPDLPDDVYVDHWVELESKHLAQYNELVEGGEAEIEGGALSIQGVLAEHTRRKQFAFGPMSYQGKHLRPIIPQSPKFEKLLELLHERGVTGKTSTDFRLEGGWKYAVGSQFSESVLEPLEQALNKVGIQTLRITGAISAKRREEAVRSWQEDPDGPRVMLLNTLAGGTALTLDAMCDEMFILDETWIDDEQFQLGGRIRNRAVEKRVATRFFHYIRTRGTIEEEIADSGLSQDEFQKNILDRARGHKAKGRKVQ